ncbi:hypothetical protein BV98_001555 [Sphingobium herbicidovorans NBRC 16415]|uniref:Uncharacterized protein n=1 Tax=Sphingobium herbicidovorans (strain ATCC 700291 / DSM 11019 / CCUG 56400 / KCTC 2939 / LMG 18315 / NBRC 16415 / MH) TaxID=1219045 RepID=A0A086PAD4_SPHHM|nr:hypothetical protein BV98_001555 [Sphingobium herbicidovorans NBRC 16415]
MVLGSGPIGSTPLGGAAQPLGNSYVENGYVQNGYLANEAETASQSPISDTVHRHQANGTETTHLTIEGERLTIGGEPITLGMPQTAPTGTSDATIAIHSASWTGFASPAEKAQAVRMMVPAALSSIDALIAHYDAPGGNGGPPLEEREALLEDLRCLHSALGLLLDAAADEKWGQYGDGLVIDAARWLGRVKSAVCRDPLSFAVAGLSEVVLGMLGFPGAGLVATAAAVGAKK